MIKFGLKSNKNNKLVKFMQTLKNADFKNILETQFIASHKISIYYNVTDEIYKTSLEAVTIINQLNDECK